MNKKRILIGLGKGLLGASVALVAMLQKIFAAALTEDEKDERRLHDLELIGTYNHRTARLDAGTDPYGWYAPVLALRITYVGELGWELHIPMESMPRVYDALQAFGDDFGLRDAGYRAIDSLRLEKGYRLWAADLTPDHTPLEAGLGWAVGWQTDFLGRTALERQREEGVHKRLATLTTDSSSVLLGRETIFRDGGRVGWLTSGGYGYTIGKSIGVGYVRSSQPVKRAWLTSGTYELEVATKRVPAQLHLAPLYDPKMERVKC